LPYGQLRNGACFIVSNSLCKFGEGDVEGTGNGAAAGDLGNAFRAV
jgi:hypothetical protein